jgi:ParB family chromosome partitioning protein
MNQSIKKRGLGRGLDALFQDTEVRNTTNETATAEGNTNQTAKNTLPIGELTPGKYQPRRYFNEDAINELASSIKEHGLIQPILVRPNPNGVGYEIIAGERRWRAAQKAQLHEVSVIIQDLSDDVALEIALIENLQREDLTPIEEAEGYLRLINEFDYTQEQLSKKLGKSRSQVTNTLRLLKLPETVRTLVQNGSLSAGHARAILSCDNPVALAQKVVKEGLSVRDTEKLAADFGGEGAGTSRKAKNKGARKDVDTLALEKELTDRMGMRVNLSPAPNGSGRITIQYKSLDQLDDLLGKLA